jgi:hypothetical protein
MAKTRDDVLTGLIEKLARTLPDDGISYADLSGNVYDKKAYLNQLQNDPDFAEQQLNAFIQPPPAKDDGITPREQATIARRFVKFAKNHQPDFDEFLRQNPALAESLNVRDIRRVMDTLKFEWNVEAIVSTELATAEGDQTVAELLAG